MQLLGRLAGRGPGTGVAWSTHGTSELLLLSLLKNRGRSRFKRRRLGAMDFGVVGSRNGGRCGEMGPTGGGRQRGSTGSDEGNRFLMVGVEQDDGGSAPAKKYRERVSSERRDREKKGGKNGRSLADRRFARSVRARRLEGKRNPRCLGLRWLLLLLLAVKASSGWRGTWRRNGDAAGTRQERRENGGRAQGLGQTYCRRAGWLRDGWICGSGGER